MNYKREENGNLVIVAFTKQEQEVIDAIIAAIVAYRKTWATEYVSAVELMSDE